jgi:predicted methyltransferase
MWQEFMIDCWLEGSDVRFEPAPPITIPPATLDFIRDWLISRRTAGLKIPSVAGILVLTATESSRMFQ